MGAFQELMNEEIKKTKFPEFGPGDIVKETGIALGTVRQALRSLVELGKIKRIGRGRGTRYVKI